MTARDTFATSLATAHTAAETGGVTPNTSATVTPPGNATTWSRTSARAALAAGAITQSQFNTVMNFLTVYEQSQHDLALATLRATGDLHPA